MLKTSNYFVDISNSGDFLVCSNNQLVWTVDFKTQEITNHKRYVSYMIHSITPDDKYCLFTSRGEEKINILSLPELDEIAVISASYVRNLKFISNDEVLFYEFDNHTNKNCIKCWNFKTGKVIELLTSDRVKGKGYNNLFMGSLFALIEKDYVCNSVNFDILNKNNYNCFNLKGDYDISCFSEIRNMKILAAKYTKNESPFSRMMGIYDIQEQTFFAIKEFSVSSLRWISEDMIWFESIVDANNAFSGTMDLKGNILWSTEGLWRVSNCSNPDYLICSSPMGSLLFKKENI